MQLLEVHREGGAVRETAAVLIIDGEVSIGFVLNDQLIVAGIVKDEVKRQREKLLDACGCRSTAVRGIKLMQGAMSSAAGAPTMRIMRTRLR